MRRESGFTLIELLMTMLILGVVLAGVAQMFSTVLTQFTQQSKIAETNIEGIIGLELLRQDLENAGFGLPWFLPGTTTYDEASTAAAYNDSPSTAPRAFCVGGGAGLNDSDELIIKATNVGRTAASQQWTYVFSEGTVTVHQWASATDNLAGTNGVIVLEPGTKAENTRTIKSVGGTWKASMAVVDDYAPNSGYNLVYGVHDTATMRMPFNRADFYIATSSTTTVQVPQRCAANTGVLVKAVISQANGSRSENLPLLDCVADMQVIFRLDRNDDGTLDDTVDVLNDTSGTALTAEQIRNQVKEVRVYILAHEGQMDRGYRHSASSITVGEFGLGHVVDVGAYLNYRWKVYTLVVKPKNLR